MFKLTIMPSQRYVHQLTGSHCCQPYRNLQQEYRHNRGLTTNQVNLRYCLQMEIMSSNFCRRFLFGHVSTLIMAASLRHNPHERLLLYREAMRCSAVDRNLFRLLNQHYVNSESLLCDIHPDADQAHVYGEPRHRSIDDLTDYEAVQFTRFTKCQLRRILRCFRIQQYMRLNGYYFTGEEVFIFGLTKCALGLNNRLLCLFVFGGNATKWSHAFKWFVHHLYNRYYPRIIGFNGLEREVHNFPYYARKIARKFNQERIYIRNQTYEIYRVPSVTIDEDRCCVAGFLDGNVTETSTCGTGPNGNYAGATRKHNFDLFQFAIYSGYKRMHGLTTLTIMLPNGIHYIYGPCSMRENDRWLANQSNLNNFLLELQNNCAALQGRIYVVYGDNTFINSECIRRAHRGDQLNPLPLQLQLQNAGMKSARVTIEHGYAECANNFKLCTQFEEFKLFQDRPHASQQLVVCYLLSNILNCLNGSQCSGRDTFFCNSPSLEEYLELGDEI